MYMFSSVKCLYNSNSDRILRFHGIELKIQYVCTILDKLFNIYLK